MTAEVPTILIAEDDDGHAFLIEDSLRRAGLQAPFRRFCDGQEVLDFLLKRETTGLQTEVPYLLLLDIRMPRVDGVQVLEKIKTDDRLKELPVIILTTTDDPREVSRCHKLGCNVYIQKPVSYDSFAGAISQLGKFVSLLQLPKLRGHAG